MKSRIFSLLALLACAILLIAIALISLLHTEKTQTYLVNTLLSEAEKHKIALQIDTLSVKAPFTWSINKVSLTLDDGTHLDLNDITCKIAPFSLVKKRLTLKSLSIEKAYLSIDLDSPSSRFLPCDLYIKKLAIPSLSLNNLKNNHSLTLNVEGKIKVDPSFQELFLDLSIEEKEGVTQSNTLDFSLLSSFKKKQITSFCDLKIQEEKNIVSFFSLTSLPQGTLMATLQGDFEKKMDFTLQSLVTKGDLPVSITPVSLQAKGSFSPFSKDPELLFCRSCAIQSPYGDLSGSFSLSKSYELLLSDLSCHIKETIAHTFPCALEGMISSSLQKNETSFSLKLSSPSLLIDQERYTLADLTITAQKEGGAWEGTCFSTLHHEKLPWKGSCHFSYDKTKVLLSDLSLSYADISLGGEASYDFINTSYQGNLFILADDLRPLRSLLSSHAIEGKVGGSFSFAGNKEDLALQLSCRLKNVRYEKNFVDLAHLDIDVSHLLSSPSGIISFDAHKILCQEILLSHIHFLSTPSSKEEEQSFSLEVEGGWKEQLSCIAQGVWHKDRKSWQVHFTACKGSFLTQCFSLESPFSIQADQDSLSWNLSSLRVGEGHLSTSHLKTANTVNFSAEGKHLPLGILSVLYPHMLFEGSASFNSSFKQSEKDVQGHLFATLEKADFSRNNKAKGSLQVHFNPLGAQVQTHLYATKNQFLEAMATIPLRYNSSFFAMHFDEKRPVTAEITMQGALEDLFDFINTGPHKISGWVTSHLLLSNTLEDPFVTGSLSCEKGTYENFMTGSKYKEIELQLVADRKEIQLSSASCLDNKNGHATIAGSIVLSPKELFPFTATISLDNLQAFEMPWMQMQTSGSLYITGNQNRAKIEGALQVDQGMFTIRDELLHETPTIPITFINKPLSLESSFFETGSMYLVSFNIDVSTKNSLSVKGRGVDSFWKGNVQLLGTLQNPAASGSLMLDKGNFVFSGKTFSLQQGEISFFDKPSPGAYLKVHGELSLAEATILAQMQGPLTSPRLTFQSIPSLPTSSILSLVLFDKDISEISALQTLQLAQTIVSLSGTGGPSVLDAIRKKIKVDRLNIIGKGDSDEISVQVGWYLTHGITLSLSQSATSSDVIVEVDLKKGFVFQAETQNQQEGKFSLKWNNNY